MKKYKKKLKYIEGINLVKFLVDGRSIVPKTSNAIAKNKKR